MYNLTAQNYTNLVPNINERTELLITNVSKSQNYEIEELFGLHGDGIVQLKKIYTNNDEVSINNLLNEFGGYHKDIVGYKVNDGVIHFFHYEMKKSNWWDIPLLNISEFVKNRLRNKLSIEEVINVFNGERPITDLISEISLA